MNLSELTLSQIRKIEKVIYMFSVEFTDTDFFEFISEYVLEASDEDSEISFDDDGTTLFIENEISWFEDEKLERGIDYV